MLISYDKTKIASNYKNAFFDKYYDLCNNASHVSGLDWNYLIAPYIDRDLHEKLLAVTQQEMAPIIAQVTMILSLIRSGYFYTAKVILAQLDVSSSATLTEIKTWLLRALTEADDTED